MGRRGKDDAPDLPSYRPEYRVWWSMRNRCEMPNHPRFTSYGGRGIGVCERWKTFANFFADMGPRPAPGLSLDRIDNDGNYEPGNCRWATSKEQSANRRQRPRKPKPEPCRMTPEEKRAKRYARHLAICNAWLREIGLMPPAEA